MVCPLLESGDLHTLAATLSMWGNNQKLKGTPMRKPGRAGAWA
jgi:hypothetical protein